MAFDTFEGLDHGEIGVFLKGNRDREERQRRAMLSCGLRASMALADKVLLGLGGKRYTQAMIREGFPELFEGKPAEKQTWQDQERIFRRFLNLPEPNDKEAQ